MLGRRSRGCVCSRLVVAAAVLRSSAGSEALARPDRSHLLGVHRGNEQQQGAQIYNGTGAPIDLAANAYNVQMCFNGSSTCSLNIPLVGTVASGDVFVAGSERRGRPQFSPRPTRRTASGWFNGDDVIVLRRAPTLLDVIGELGSTRTEWGRPHQHRRQHAAPEGDDRGRRHHPLDVFDPAIEWDGFATDDFTGLGAHSTVVPTPLRR